MRHKLTKVNRLQKKLAIPNCEMFYFFKLEFLTDHFALFVNHRAEFCEDLIDVNNVALKKKNDKIKHSYTINGC